MKELKKGDFTGIYSQIDGKPLFYTGQYDYMECDGLPCVWLATDIHNNLTFSRWSQKELNKRGWTIPPRPVEISNTAMQMINKAGAVIRWTTAEERRQACTDKQRKSPYILTAANGGQWYTTGTCADVREVLKAAADEATTRPQDGPTAPETETAGETTNSSEKAPQEGTQDATERQKRRTAYMVECRSPRGSWKQYSGEKDTREEAEKIKEEAEAQRACTVNGDLILYRIVQLDKGPEKASQDAPTARQTAGTNAAEETPTEATKARQEATSDATTAETATEGPKTSTPAQDTTGSDTRPPRATEEATTGHAANNTSTPATAAGDTSTPANQEPGTAAGYSNKAQQDATTCDIMRQHATPGHACENAPERTERAQAEQVHTPPRKTPTRGKYKATQNRPPKFGKICAKIRVPSGALYFTGAG